MVDCCFASDGVPSCAKITSGKNWNSKNKRVEFLNIDGKVKVFGFDSYISIVFVFYQIYLLFIMKCSVILVLTLIIQFGLIELVKTYNLKRLVF